jgi:isoleucyl-tRNA synthetase
MTHAAVLNASTNVTTCNTNTALLNVSHNCAQRTLLLQDVKDPSIVVSFECKEEPSTFLLAWTSTPWTLPSNLALCVNPEYEYIKVRCV